MMREGFIAQQRIEEIRTEQVAMQTVAQMTEAALKHDEKILDRSSKWVANYIGTVRPTITYIFVIELVLINFYLMYWGLNSPGFLNNIQDLIAFSDVVFSSDEMAMLGGVIGYWFGARGWSKK
jgi:adenosylmethionine-8-amino-7-oxononanoate aminotransferase